MPTPAPWPAAVLLDLDGTLIDSVPDIEAALNATLAAAGRREVSRTEVVPMIGDGARELVARGFAATGAALDDAGKAEATRRFLGFYEEAPTARTEIYPGVVDTLAALAAAGVGLSVCTNKPHHLSEVILSGLKLMPPIGAVVGGNALPRRKPHPDHPIEAARRVGADPARAVMVGDSANDVLAARAAGMPSIVVRYGYSKVAVEKLGADLIIDRFDDLPDALRRLAGARG